MLGREPWRKDWVGRNAPWAPSREDRFWHGTPAHLDGLPFGRVGANNRDDQSLTDSIDSFELSNTIKLTPELVIGWDGGTREWNKP